MNTGDFLICLSVGLCFSSRIFAPSFTSYKFSWCITQSGGIKARNVPFSLPAPINLKETAFARTGMLISECDVSFLMAVMSMANRRLLQNTFIWRENYLFCHFCTLWNLLNWSPYKRRCLILKVCENTASLWRFISINDFKTNIWAAPTQAMLLLHFNLSTFTSPHPKIRLIYLSFRSCVCS